MFGMKKRTVFYVWQVGVNGPLDVTPSQSEADKTCEYLNACGEGRYYVTEGFIYDPAPPQIEQSAWNDGVEC